MKVSCNEVMISGWLVALFFLVICLLFLNLSNSLFTREKENNFTKCENVEFTKENSKITNINSSTKCLQIDPMINVIRISTI